MSQPLEAVVQEFGHYDDCSRGTAPDHDRVEPVCASRVSDLRDAILSLLTATAGCFPSCPGHYSHAAARPAEAQAGAGIDAGLLAALLDKHEPMYEDSEAGGAYAGCTCGERPESWSLHVARLASLPTEPEAER